jgi:UDP-N-acetylmuramate--alanine ligase
MIDLNKIKKVYIIGIEGAGTSALARILKFAEKDVSGSDEGDHFYNPVLKSEGIEVNHKFDANNIPKDADVIIYGSSFKIETNEELKAAFESGKNVLTYAEALAVIFNKKYGISVCGTHGKSTTSALLSFVMNYIGLNPSAIVGAKIPQLEGNSILGKSEYFIIEADEFQNKLKLYEPRAVILTSLDWDHPDTFPTFSDYKKAFTDFVEKIPRTGFLVVWGDSADTLEAAKNAKCEVIKYGYGEDNDWIISNFQSPISNQIPILDSQIEMQSFNISYKDKVFNNFQTRLVGKHNVLNAAAVAVICYKLNLDMEKVREGIANFKGVSRRFEYVGQRNGAILIDDYGHHPEEIKATLKGARGKYESKNIIAVFHPHSYSRTEALLQEFSQSFDDADQVIILDIYGSARENSGQISSRDLVNLINKYSFGKAEYIPTIDEAVNFLQDKIGENDLVLTIGAGNVFQVAEKLAEK